MDVWRPCDTVESTVAWIAAIERRDGPSSLLFSRQNLNFCKRGAAQLADVARGGYVLSDAQNPKAVIIATGSEVTLALEAQKLLAAENIAVRVVSMPATTVFDRQDAAYQASVLPKGVPRVAVEAGVSDFWRKYVGLEGAVVGIDRYGESAPAGALFEYFGFTAANIATTVKITL
jgi:transketolase